MPAPSQLAIATQAVTRLLREEISYEQELIQQQGKVTRLEAEVQSGLPDEDGNRAHMLKQLVSSPPYMTCNEHQVAPPGKDQLESKRVVAACPWLKQAVVETENVFPRIKERIGDATTKLEEQIALAESNGTPAEELELARVALTKGQEAQNTVRNGIA
ncbi:tubulin-specific chaperone Rbl2 [Verticillium dahliae]